MYLAMLAYSMLTRQLRLTVRAVSLDQPFGALLPSPASPRTRHETSGNDFKRWWVLHTPLSNSWQCWRPTKRRQPPLSASFLATARPHHRGVQGRRISFGRLSFSSAELAECV
jgi:hypothetical protein